MKVGVFPLDDHLDLETGSLTPCSQDHLVHVAVWMPFEKAVRMLERVTGVHTSEATTRRQTYRAGEATLAVQQAPSSDLAPTSSDAAHPSKMIVRVDGAMVPLVKGTWAEVKTVVVGCVESKRPKEPAVSTHLSYFSRMVEAQPFPEQASGEMLRRGVDQADQVCAVMDGAEWIDGLVDWQCKDAVRILDFAHAAEYMSEIGQLAQAAGTVLPHDWLSVQLHERKHEGPAAVLREVRNLRDSHPEGEEISKKVAYLEKREARMQYPPYQKAGWPIGSGIVESGNNVVMQARLKGAGMHWDPVHVNPMLALRTTACNDRWDETAQARQSLLAAQRLNQRRMRQSERYEHLVFRLQIGLLLLQTRSKPQPSVPTVLSTPSLHAKASRPAATHPWRRPLLAKK